MNDNGNFETRRVQFQTNGARCMNPIEMKS